MSKKTIASISIDDELRKKARAHGINISKVTENTLKILLQRLEDVELPKEKPIETKNEVKESKGKQPEEIFPEEI